jgi:hypothetical protein
MLRLCSLTSTALATIVTCSTVALEATATLYYYDPFITGSNPAAGEYTPGLIDTTLSAPGGGQNPTVGPTPYFTGEWEVVDNAPNATVQETGLSYIGAPAAGGSQLSNADSRPRRYLSSPWTAATEGTHYISFLANFGQGDYSDGVQNNDMGYRAVEFLNDANEFLFSLAYNSFNGTGGAAQQNPATAKIYLDGFGYQILQGSPNSFMEDGLTHLFVVRFDLSATAASDSVSVYLDPKHPANEPAASATLTGIDVTLGAVGGMTRYGGSGIAPVFDELRVADTYAEALPPLPFPGDTNGDDLVDLVDYQAIITNMNQPGVFSLAQGDVTGDGKVGIDDYRFWKERRTDTESGAGGLFGASVGVPEPSTCMLIVIGMALAAASEKCQGRVRL